MSKIYDALNELGSSPFDAPNGSLGTRISPSTAASVGNELVELEKMFVHRIGRLRAAADEAELSVASERQRAAQTIETLKDEIKALDDRLAETRTILERKNLANQAIERDLNLRINELQIALRKQEEVLASRASEVIALKSEMNRLQNGIQEMLSAVSHHAQALASNPAEHLRPVAIGESAKTGGADSSVWSRVAVPAVPSVETDSSSNFVPATFER